MKEKDQFENARQFLGCYFHQDFCDEFGEPEIAVERFVQENSAEFRGAVARELDRAIAECDDRQLTDLIFSLGCYYSPDRHRGVSMREWLGKVIAALERSLTEK